MENKEWFLYVVDHHEGPFTADEIKTRVKGGEAKPTSYVWKEGYADWVMMSEVADFERGGDGHGQPAFVVTTSPANQAVSLGGISDSDAVFCLNSGKVYAGPFSIKTLVRKLNQGDASTNDSVWKEGWTGFVPISTIPEIMNQVKLETSSEKKSKKDQAAVIGLSSSAPRASRRATRPLVLLAVLFGLISLYQALASGLLEAPLKAVSLDERVKALELQPLPFGKAVDDAANLIRPLANVAPEPIRSWFSGVEFPEGLTPEQQEALRQAALSPLAQGAMITTALPVGDEFNPSFVIATNLPDGTTLKVTLTGRAGMLLNAMGYEKTVMVDVSNKLARTIRFSLDGSKPLPRGEYLLIIHELDQQVPDVAAALAGLPKKNAPSKLIPPGRVAFSLDSYFLGGKRDASYNQRLREYNDRIRTKKGEELAELRQLLLTVESMANDGANSFFALAKVNSVATRKARWSKSSAQHKKLAAQLQAALSRPHDGMLLAPLYQELRSTYELTQALYHVETNFIEGRGNLDAVRSQAARAAAAISTMKQHLAGVQK